MDPPGEAGTGGAEQELFVAGPGHFTTGLWRPRARHVVVRAALPRGRGDPRGDADVVADDGTVHTVGAGDVLVTPKGTAGTWRIRETIVKSYTILEVD